MKTGVQAITLDGDRIITVRSSAKTTIYRRRRTLRHGSWRVIEICAQGKILAEYETDDPPSYVLRRA